MRLETIGKGTGLLFLAAGLCAAAFAAPHFPMGDGPVANDDELETTISVKSSVDREATVVKVPDLSIGETRTVTSEGGRPVEVTRTESGITVKVDEKSYQVRLLNEGSLVLVGEDQGDGEPSARAITVVSPGGKDGARSEKKVVVLEKGRGHGRRVVVSPGAHAYWVGDEKRPTAAEILKQSDPKALSGADARTRATVEKALDELIESGAVLPVGGRCSASAASSSSDDGEQVEIRVIRKPKSED